MQRYVFLTTLHGKETLTTEELTSLSTALRNTNGYISGVALSGASVHPKILSVYCETQLDAADYAQVVAIVEEQVGTHLPEH